MMSVGMLHSITVTTVEILEYNADPKCFLRFHFLPPHSKDSKDSCCRADLNQASQHTATFTPVDQFLQINQKL